MIIPYFFHTLYFELCVCLIYILCKHVIHRSVWAQSIGKWLVNITLVQPGFFSRIPIDFRPSRLHFSLTLKRTVVINWALCSVASVFEHFKFGTWILCTLSFLHLNFYFLVSVFCLTGEGGWRGLWAVGMSGEHRELRTDLRDTPEW